MQSKKERKERSQGRKGGEEEGEQEVMGGCRGRMQRKDGRKPRKEGINK